MKKFYLSLCRGLVGNYVLFIAPDEETVRKHATEYFGRMWCSVYEEQYYTNFIAVRHSAQHVINADKPIVLENGWEWE